MFGCGVADNRLKPRGVAPGGPDATISGEEDLSRVVRVRWSKDRMGFRSYDTSDAESSIVFPEAPVLTHRWSRPMGECVDASPLLLSVLNSDRTGTRNVKLFV